MLKPASVSTTAESRNGLYLLNVLEGNGYYKHDRGGVVRYTHVPTKTADNKS